MQPYLRGVEPHGVRAAPQLAGEMGRYGPLWEFAEGLDTTVVCSSA